MKVVIIKMIILMFMMIMIIMKIILTIIMIMMAVSIQGNGKTAVTCWQEELKPSSAAFWPFQTIIVLPNFNNETMMTMIILTNINNLYASRYPPFWALQRIFSDDYWWIMKKIVIVITIIILTNKDNDLVSRMSNHFQLFKGW